MSNKLKYGVVLVMVIVAAAYWYCQPIVQFKEGHPWDAEAYFLMAEQVAHQQPMRAEKPFVYRLATSWIVGKLFPTQIVLGFYVINALFSLGILITTAMLLRRYFRSFLTLVVLLLLCIANPSGPVRLYSFFPVFTDPSALFFILTIFVLAGARSNSASRNILLVLLATIGVFFREIVLLAPLSLLLESLYWRYIRKIPVQSDSVGWRLLAVIGGCLGIVVTHSLVIGLGDYTFMSHIHYSLSRHIAYPAIFPVALLVTYGPLLLIVILNLRYALKAIVSIPYLSSYMVLLLILALIGGLHTDRFVSWGFPAILVMEGFVLEKLVRHSQRRWQCYLFWGVLILAQLFAFRVFSTVPNAQVDVLANSDSATPMPMLLILSPYGEGTNMTQFYAAFMSNVQRLAMLCQYAGFGLFFALTMPKVVWRRQ